MIRRVDSALTTTSDRFPVVMLLFVGSGCAALIYEVVWFQLLRFVIGASAISLGILLASFMGGMCLGSLGYSSLVSARRHPLRVYAILEFGIAAVGIALPNILPHVSKFYTANVGYGASGVMFRAAVCAVCLLPPAILMGATLPAIGRWVKSTPAGISRLGFFYGANTIGAVCGCLLAGFYLLPNYDLLSATYFAAAVNVTVGVMALYLAWGLSYRPDEISTTEQAAPAFFPSVYVVIALSGLTALGAEVIWTRLLSLLFGVTVYTFSIILAVFLAGLGVGSSLGSALVRWVVRPRLALAFTQLGLVFCIPFAAYMIAEHIPYWPPKEDPLLAGMNPVFINDIIRCTAAIFLPTILWGASFPIALAAAGMRGRDPARMVGRVYAANTAGAIVGSLLFSFMVIPIWGTHGAQQWLVVIAGLASLLMFASVFAEPGTTATGLADSREFRRPQIPWRGALTGLLLVGLIASAAVLLPATPKSLFLYGRDISRKDFASHPSAQGELVSLVEGVNISVAVRDWRGRMSLHLSGKVVASDTPIDMWLQRTLGHLPALVHPNPRSVLVVGMGAGVTAGSFVVHPEIERIVICEIEPRVRDAAGRYFADVNHHVLEDPRTEVIFDDGRHFMATTKEKFDIITSDPIHPYVRGAAALYSADYFELCKQHLNPGGVITQWVPLYETNEAAVKSSLATQFQAFPESTLWGANLGRDGYDLVTLGQLQPTKIDLLDIVDKIERNPALRQSMGEVGMISAAQILGAYAGYARDLQPWLQTAEINRDANLRLEYLAGLSLNNADAAPIMAAIVRHRKYSKRVFAASEISTSFKDCVFCRRRRRSKARWVATS